MRCEFREVFQLLGKDLATSYAKSRKSLPQVRTRHLVWVLKRHKMFLGFAPSEAKAGILWVKSSRSSYQNAASVTNLRTMKAKRQITEAYDFSTESYGLFNRGMRTISTEACGHFNRGIRTFRADGRVYIWRKSRNFSFAKPLLPGNRKKNVLFFGFSFTLS